MQDLPRGLVTFVFSDIEGSTRLWEQLPHAMGSALNRHNGLVEDAIDGHGGKRFAFVGDAYCAAFADPRAAVLAAAAAQRAITYERWGPVTPLRIRIAVHSAIDVEPNGNNYHGLELSRTHRIMELAHGGQVLLSTTTTMLIRDLLPPHLSVRELGLHKLKDIREPERVYQLLAADLPAEFPALAEAAPAAAPVAIPGTVPLPVGQEGNRNPRRRSRFWRRVALVALAIAVGAASGLRAFERIGDDSRPTSTVTAPTEAAALATPPTPSPTPTPTPSPTATNEPVRSYALLPIIPAEVSLVGPNVETNDVYRVAPPAEEGPLRVRIRDGDRVILSGCADRDCDVSVDDAVRIYVTTSEEAMAGAEPVADVPLRGADAPALDITRHFRQGTNYVRIELVDLRGSSRGAHFPFYLVVLSA